MNITGADAKVHGSAIESFDHPMESVHLLHYNQSKDVHMQTLLPCITWVETLI